jgi:hypothetical protein
MGKIQQLIMAEKLAAKIDQEWNSHFSQSGPFH